jgi:hypothetical protein
LPPFEKGGMGGFRGIRAYANIPLWLGLSRVTD